MRTDRYSMKKDYDLYIFDLDGTILDTSEGVTNSVKYAESQLGLDKLPYEKQKMFIGPPPTDLYMKLYHLDRNTAEKATRFHREYTKKNALTMAKVYPGVVHVLEELKKAGKKLAVGTLKREDMARALLEYYEIADFFDLIMGMDELESLTKADILVKISMRLNALSPVLIGDTVYDKEGADGAKIDFIGVTYGFGFVDGKDYNFQTIGDLTTLLPGDAP